MKVTVILEPDDSTSIKVSDDTENFAPSKPTASQTITAIQAAANECIRRAMELGLVL